MSQVSRRLAELHIEPEEIVFSITCERLLWTINNEVDFETVTNHELKEIFTIVRRAVSRINWEQQVVYAVDHLPFGLNQTGIAFDGGYPCTGCPDSMMENGSCYHEGECKSWETYEATNGRIAL